MQQSHAPSQGNTPRTSTILSLVLGVVAYVTLLPVSPASAADSAPLEGSGDTATTAATSELPAAALEPLVARSSSAIQVAPYVLLNAMRHDSTLRVGRTQQVFVKDSAPAVRTQGPAPKATTSDVFALSSRPEAPLTIYLDFDGHTTTGTLWNTDDGKSTIVSKPYDTDGRPGFSPEERGVVQAVWAAVAQDFSPFDINVTTSAPREDRLTRWIPEDPFFGVRVVITSSQAFDSNVVGIAYVGKFGDKTDLPVFVFADGSDATRIRLTASHEVGHAFGLLHDGTDHDGEKEEYYAGHTAWQPIMGSGPSERIGQWSRGEYPGANNREDDIQIISRTAPFIEDDFTNTPANAALAPARTFRGLISNEQDKDWIRIEHRGGPFSASVAPVAGSSVDVGLELVRGTTVIAMNQQTGLKAAISTKNLAAGTYFFSIDGVGEGDPATDGYSDYGSIGQYRVVLEGAIAVALPFQVIASSYVGPQGAAPVGDVVRFFVRPTGQQTTAGWVVRWSFSNGRTYVGVNAETPMLNATLRAMATVESPYGTVAVASTYVRPGRVPVIARVDSPKQVSVGAPVIFSAAAADADGHELEYVWFFSDGAELRGATVQRTFTDAGSAYADLRVTDPTGLSVSARAETFVTATAPTLAVTVGSIKAGAPVDVTFSAKTSSRYGADSVLWQFSDKTSSAAAKTSKRFLSRGDKTVIVTVTDRFGCTAAATITFAVKSTPSKAKVSPKYVPQPAYCTAS